MKNPKIKVAFENRILDVKYLDNAVINADDIRQIYDFGNLWSNGKPYGIMFEPLGRYEVTEDAIQFMGENPGNEQVLAKVYVLNSKEAETKTKFHLMFDKPELKPQMFKTAEEGRRFLESVVAGK